VAIYDDWGGTWKVATVLLYRYYFRISLIKMRNSYYKHFILKRIYSIIIIIYGDVILIKLSENCIEFRDVKYDYRFRKEVSVICKITERNEQQI
jgi:hypothetical protein